MISGTIVDEFEIEDLGELKLRYLEMSDTENLLELMNSLVEEKANIRYRRKLGLEEQIDWTAEMLKRIEKKKRVQLVVEKDGKAVGSMSVNLDEESKSHVGEVGIVLAEEIRGKGVGERELWERC